MVDCRFSCRGPGSDAKRTGLVLTEVMVVVFIASLFMVLAMMNLMGITGKHRFKSRAHDLAKTMKMAVTAAAQSSRRYEMIFDFTTDSYMLREITAGLYDDILEDEIIMTGVFDDEFQLSYVMFDDFETTNEGRALFRCGRAGWQFGGKVVVLDGQGNEYSFVVNRAGRVVRLENGDAEILTPKDREDVPF